MDSSCPADLYVYMLSNFVYQAIALRSLLIVRSVSMCISDMVQ